MQSDLPHTLYLKEGFKGSGDKQSAGTNKYNPNDKAFALQEEANRRARERRLAKARGEGEFTTNELFSK